MIARVLPIVGILAYVAAATVSVRSATNKDVVLAPPTGTSGVDAGVIWVEGAGLSASQYQPIAQRVQEAAATNGIRLWVGIPQCLLSVCEPLVLPGDVNRTWTSLTQIGLPVNATMFAAAHSVGGVFLDMLVANPPKNYQPRFSGVVLMGSFILRTANRTWDTPVLQIAGELDGLCRITRMAQAYYFQLGQRGGSTGPAVYNFPVGVIQGGTHMTFASGTPPTLVEDEDLKPTVSESQVHLEVAQYFSNWLAIQLAQSGEGISQGVVANAKLNISAWVEDSYADYFEPILDAFELEGNYQIKPPCDCENSCNPAEIPAGDAQCGSDPFGKVNYNPCFPNQIAPYCRAGSSWGPKIQHAIGTFYTAENETADFNLNVSCAFHPVQQTKPHSNLPFVFNNCSSPGQDCNLRMNIIQENQYDSDPLDTGFFVQSAIQIGLKMKSRQWIRTQAGYSKVSYNGSDGEQLELCQQGNKLALEYAMGKLTTGQSSRYDAIGQKIVWGPDQPKIGGPWFIDAPLYRKSNDTAGTLELSSPSLVTPFPFFIESAAAMHYCKVLSPANALEWIILDSLRLKGSLKSKQ